MPRFVYQIIIIIIILFYFFIFFFHSFALVTRQKRGVEFRLITRNASRGVNLEMECFNTRFSLSNLARLSLVNEWLVNFIRRAIKTFRVFSEGL